MAKTLEIASIFFGSQKGDIVLDGKTIPISLEKSYLSGNNRIVRRFEADDKTSSSGAFILLRSEGILPPTQFNGEHSVVQDTFIVGTGVLLGVSGDNGEIFEREFQVAQQERSIGIQYDRGDTAMWAAGEGGFVLLRTLTPAAQGRQVGRVVNIFNAGEVPREYGIACTRLLMSTVQ